MHAKIKQDQAKPTELGAEMCNAYPLNACLGQKVSLAIFSVDQQIGTKSTWLARRSKVMNPLWVKWFYCSPTVDFQDHHQKCSGWSWFPWKHKPLKISLIVLKGTQKPTIKLGVQSRLKRKDKMYSALQSVASYLFWSVMIECSVLKHSWMFM